MNKKYKLLIKDTLVFALGSLGSKLILFLLVPLFTNYLTTAEYGTADLVTSFSQLLFPIVSLSINSAIIRFALKKGEKAENVILATFSVFIYSILACIVSYILLSYYKPIAGWRIYLIVYVFLSTLSESGKSYLKAKNNNKTFAVINVTQTFVLAISNIVLLTKLHTGVKGYLLANIIAVGVTSVLSLIFSGAFKDMKKAEFDKKLLKRMLLYSSPLILNNMSWWVVHSSDKIMIEMMINASALGIYASATKIPSLINVIISIFNQAWGLSSIREIESDNDEGFYSSVFSIYYLLTFGATVFVISIIKPFMAVYVGLSFQTAWKYTPLLLVAAAFNSISTYYGSLYTATEKTINSMVTTILCAIVNVVVNYVFIIRIGAFGAVIGTVTSYFVLAIVRMIDMTRFVSVNVDIIRFFNNIIILTVEGILASLDWHVYFVSLICIISFAIINHKVIINTMNKIDLKSFIKR